MVVEKVIPNRYLFSFTHTQAPAATTSIRVLVLCVTTIAWIPITWITTWITTISISVPGARHSLRGCPWSSSLGRDLRPGSIASIRCSSSSSLLRPRCPWTRQLPLPASPVWSTSSRTPPRRSRSCRSGLEDASPSVIWTSGTVVSTPRRLCRGARAMAPFP